MRLAFAAFSFLVLTACQTPDTPAAGDPGAPVPSEMDMIDAASRDAGAPAEDPEEEAKKAAAKAKADGEPQTGGAAPGGDIALPDAGAEPDDGKRYAIGKLDDPDVKEAAYAALDRLLSKDITRPDGIDVTTELADAERFKYSVLKMLRGHDDVTSNRPTAADGMDVSVIGWYKRQEGAKAPACASFEATVSLVRRGGAWIQADGTEPTLNRETGEDCYN